MKTMRRAYDCQRPPSRAPAPLRWRTLLAVLLLTAAMPKAYAHKPSDAYLSLQVQGQDLTVRWDIALRDLDNELGLDADDDGQLTWREVRERSADIAALAMPALRVIGDGKDCLPTSQPTPAATAMTLANHSDGTYAVLRFQLHCPTVVRELQFDYRLFASSDPTHRGILNIRGADGLSLATTVLDPEHPMRRVSLTGEHGLATLREFVAEGIWHIWTGFDHLLFLLSLLLPSVLVMRLLPVTRPTLNDASIPWPPAGSTVPWQWQGATSLRASLIDVLRIVTAFTLAHSITLSLAVLDIVSLPPRLVESGIALTVILAAINNLRPFLRARRWAAAFVFGLIHGFGFAAALKDLGLSTHSLALSLFGFNLGVEIGQLAIVALFLPLAYAARHTVFYRRAILGPGSAVIASLAAVWLVERVFDLKLIEFGT